MKKGQKHLEETKRNMSLTRRGNNHLYIGRKHSQETIEKIKIARAKQVNTPESNRKRSETQKGRIFSKESKEKMRQHALKRFSDKKNHPNFGKPLPQKIKDNISKALKGIKLDQLHTPKKAEEIRKKIKTARAKQIFPLEDTSIEVKIQNFLKELGIEFFTHQHMSIKHSYQCDIFIPSLNLVVECDGDYWHRYPTGTEIDHIRTKELIQKGFRVLRLWEFEIKDMNLNNFKDKLK